MILFYLLILKDAHILIIFCSLIVKPTCLELFNSRTATEEICNKAKISSDKKICSLKSDNSGCDEFNKPESNSSSKTK